MMTAAMVLGGQSLGAIGVSAGNQASLPEPIVVTPDKNDVYSIKNAGQLVWFANQVNDGNTFSGKTVKLIADIDLGDAEWTPIGVGHFTSNIPDADADRAFAGTFDGNNMVISNYCVSHTSVEDNLNIGNYDKATGTNDYDYNLKNNYHSKGLFGYVNGGTVENFTVTGAKVDGWNAEAAVIGTMGSGTVQHITVKDSAISGTFENAGAVVGRQAGNNFSITNCYVDNCNITLTSETETADKVYKNGAGALIGRTEGGSPIISNNLVYGCTISAYRKASGLVGYLLQPTGLTMQNNDISGTNVNIHSPVPGNKLNDPYFGILFSEIQGSPNTQRAYESSSSYTIYNFSYTNGATAQNCHTENIAAPKLLNASVSGSALTINQFWQSTSEPVASLASGGQFSDLRFAVECANNGDIVTLLKDCTLDQMILLKKNLKVVLAGHSIT